MNLPFNLRVFDDDPTKVYLRDFQFRVHERFLYTYDFGDNWEHEVRLEKVGVNPAAVS